MNDLFYKSACIIVMILLVTDGGAQEKFSLEEAISYAIDNSKSVKIQDLEIKNSEYTIKETRAIGIPKITGGIDYSYYIDTPKQPVQDFIGPSVYGILNKEGLIQKAPPAPETFELSFVQPNQLTFNLAANSLIFDGSYIVGLQASKVYKELAVRQKTAAVEKVRNQVTKAYTSILITGLKKTFIEDNIKSVSSSLKDMRAMYDNGFVESLDVDRLELSLEQLKTQNANIDQLEELSYNLLKFQMGYPLDKKIEITESLDELLVLFGAEDEVLTDGIDPNNREDYRVLETVQKLNQLDLKRYKWGYLPQLVGFVSHQQSLQRKKLFDNKETGFLPTTVLGLKLGIPIYDGGDKSAKIQKAKINIEKTQIQQEMFEEGMKLEVQNALANINNAKRDVANTKSTLEKTQQIYDKTKIKFDEGVGSSVEVTQAESSLYTAQSQYADALYRLLEAKVTLDLALGKQQ